MLNPRISSRYAKSLIDLAIQTGRLGQIYQDALLLQTILKNSRDLLSLVRNPIVSADRKSKIFRTIFSGKVDEITEKFCQLLISKGREAFLPEIAGDLVFQYQQIKNINRVSITTALKIEPEMEQAILKKIRESTPLENVALETKVDEALIGGFVLETGGNLFDASIQKDLKDIRSQFMENTYLLKLR